MFGGVAAELETGIAELPRRCGPLLRAGQFSAGFEAELINITKVPICPGASDPQRACCKRLLFPLSYTSDLKQTLLLSGKSGAFADFAKREGSPTACRIQIAQGLRRLFKKGEKRKSFSAKEIKFITSKLLLYFCGMKGLLCVMINTAQPCLRFAIPPANPVRGSSEGSLQLKTTV